jgi:hypothetical protein
MSELHTICAQFRAEGIPIHVRIYDTLLGEPRHWVYYGYTPAIARGVTYREALIAVDVAVRVHRKIRANEAVLAEQEAAA